MGNTTNSLSDRGEKQLKEYGTSKYLAKPFEKLSKVVDEAISKWSKRALK